MNVLRLRSQRRRSFSVFAVSVVCLFSTVTPTSAQMVSQITIPLNEYAESGVSGISSLSAVGNYVQVSMSLNGSQVTGDHPTHIHTGTCEDFDPNPIFPLTTVVLGHVDGEGSSRSLVRDISLRELLAGKYVIVVHKSAEELTNYFVCGDISGEALAMVQTDVDNPGSVSVNEVNVVPGEGSTSSAHTRHGSRPAASETATRVGQRKIVAVPSAGSGQPTDHGGDTTHLAIGLEIIALVLVLGGVTVVERRASRDSTPRRPCRRAT